MNAGSSSVERDRALGVAWQQQRLRAYAAACVLGLIVTVWFRWPGAALATALCVAGTLDCAAGLRMENRRIPLAIIVDAFLIALMLAIVVAPPPAVAFFVGYYVVAVMVLAPRLAAPLLLGVAGLAAGVLLIPELAGATVTVTQATVIGISAAIIFSFNTAVLLMAVDRELRRLDEQTDRRIDFSAAVADSAKRLLSGTGEGNLEATLQILADALRAGSVFVERNFDDPVRGLCTTLVAACDRQYEDPVPRERWEMVPWTAYPKAHEHLSTGMHFHFTVDELEGTEREMYEGTAIGSEIDIPIFVNEHWLGMIGVSDTDPGYTWREEDIALLRSLADMIGAHWQREEAARTRQALIESLDDRVRYERAMATCSRALLGGVEGGIESALAALIEATGAEFAFVDLTVDHPELGLSAVLVAEAVRPGYEGQIRADGWQDHTLDAPILDVIPYSSMPTGYKALSEGQVALTVTSELEEGTERAIYERGGVLSELCIPFFVQGRWHGSVGFTQFSHMRDWEVREIEILRTAAEMFGAAFERQAVRSRLEALLDSKDELIAGVSHELRTPLTVVMGLSDELATNEDFESAEARALMRMVATQSREMADIVEDLLVAARTDDGSVAVVPETVELIGLAETVVTYLSIPSSRTFRIDGDPTEAWADPGRVRQIVRNLITNAIRYGGDHITINVERHGSAVLEVIDDGPGVPDDSVVAVFEPYQRAHNRPTQPSSVGLGLTLSRRLARLMGGDLEYAPRDGLCVFRLTLPGPARSDSHAGNALQRSGVAADDRRRHR